MSLDTRKAKCCGTCEFWDEDHEDYGRWEYSFCTLKNEPMIVVVVCKKHEWRKKEDPELKGIINSE